MRHNNRRLPSAGNNRNNNNNNNNNKFRRPNNQNAQSRANALYDRDEMSDIVSPQQRRHASNQQTKFLDLAKNAKQNGDRVEMEYYMQHVEHYTRVLTLADAQDAARHLERGNRHNNVQNRADNQNINENDVRLENSSEDAEDGVDESEGSSDESDEERRLRTERNRARRRNRRLRRTNYESNQTGDASENTDERVDSVAEKTVKIVKAKINENNVNDESANKSDDSIPLAVRKVILDAGETIKPESAEQQPKQVKAEKVSRIKRTPRFKIDVESESNSGEILRDLLPAPKMD